MDVAHQANYFGGGRMMPGYPYNHQHPHFPLSVKTEGIPTSLSSLTNGVESHMNSSLMPDFNSAITP